MTLRALTFALDHLAITNGLYYVGVLTVMQACVTPSRPFPGWWESGFVACLAVSTYLLDRVKPGRRFLDPADQLAHPERSVFMYRYALPVRGLCLSTGLAAALIGLTFSGLAPLVVIGAWGGVLYYARPRGTGWRPKDAFVIKNLCVSAAAVALCLTTLLLADPALWSTDAFARLAGGAIIVGLIVLGDAALCDLDDVAGDAPFGTRTIPVVRGRRATWGLAHAMHFAAAVLLVWLIISSGVPDRLGWLIGGGLVLTNICLQACRLRSYRPWIDGRLGLLAVMFLLVAA